MPAQDTRLGAAAHGRRHPPVRLARFDHGHVDGRHRLDPAHRPVPDRRDGQPQPGKEAGVAGQSPQLGRTGQDRGQSPCGEVGEEVLAVGGTGEAGDDPCRDGEGLHGRGSGAAVGAIGVLAGPQPVHDVDGGESEGDRQRDRGEASTEAQTVVERMPACLCPAEEPTAEARRAESPGRLAHGSPQRVVGSGWKGPQDRESEGDGRTVHRDRGGALSGQGRSLPGEEPRRGCQRIVRPSGEQVVQARPQPAMPWSTALLADRDGANVPGAIAAAITSPTSRPALEVRIRSRLRRPARVARLPMAG
jgi:hypothetical protein